MDGGAPAPAFLAYVPENERDLMLEGLIKSLQLDDLPSLTFVASLVLRYANQDNKRGLLSVLETAVYTGRVEAAVSISLRFPELGSELLSAAAQTLTNAKSSDGRLAGESAILSCLSFTQTAIPRLPLCNAHVQILHGCLDLLSAEDVQIEMSARDVVFKILAIPDQMVQKIVVLPSLPSVWNCIQSLLSSGRNDRHYRLGYSLWLRLIMSTRIEHFKALINNDYWQYILQGLRHGDSETRKLCLNILKLTTAADSDVVSGDVREQYERYCTIFEIIVLGRYINQIQECEKDLNSLASNSSLPPKWLFALLASALDTQMQDSNRKFIGNWIMDSGLKPTDEFLRFFRDDFLPWAVQGTLFVSTLRKQDDRLHCLHGDRLAGLIRNMLKACVAPAQLSTIVVNAMLDKSRSLFAYAVVYLLEGVEDALRDDQKQAVSQITAVPEVARDYILLRTSSLSGAEVNAKFVSQREILEEKAIARCNSFNHAADDIEDLWTDLDYLDYPKRLLMIIPQAIMHPIMVQRASREPHLADFLAAKLEVLRKMAEYKAYIFSPLATALRKAVASNAAAVDIFDIEQFIVNVTEHPPEATTDLLLEEATTYLTPFAYEHYFGERLSHGFAALIDLVSRLKEHAGIVERILLRILQRWNNQKLPPPTVSVWKNALQLQILLLCFEQYDPPSPLQLSNLLEDVFHILAVEPLPQYRYLLEWIAIRMLARFDLQNVLLERLGTRDHHSNPKHLASLMKIAVILACDRGSDEEFALRLATTFVPLAASSKIVIRHEAQWQTPLLMDHARTKEWSQIIDNPAFAALDDHIRSLERFYDPPHERKAGRFDPVNDCNLTNLVEGHWLMFDLSEPALTSRQEFIKLCATDLPAPCIPLGDAVQHRKPSNETFPSTGKAVARTRTAEDFSAVQTKGAAHLARALSDPSLLGRRSNNLIVVGSLVDNPHNLGGLSRVSEIFGVSALYVPNHNVVLNKDFANVSVSSHLHFPVVPLPASSILEFLMERKSDGFTIVGIEQTDRSVTLGSSNANLSEKVVLVVGSEKEGIPAAVLTECDLLVEIPQQGVTRSLNVQTAVSIVLYEHARQHGFT